MAKICKNCGKEVIENSLFCDNCGAPVGETPLTPPSSMGSMIEKRNIVMCIILSFVTCGIYGIIWFIRMHEDANTITNDHKTSGAMAFVYTIITCGIYQFIWYYNMGKKLYAAGQASGRSISDNAILYLVLPFFGLGIVSYALIQNDLNQFSNQQ